jgi:hypothetical protein
MCDEQGENEKKHAPKSTLPTVENYSTCRSSVQLKNLNLWRRKWKQLHRFTAVFVL